MVRREISFDADGTVLRGRLDLPPAAAGHRFPAVVLCQGLGALKEWLEPTVEVFNSGGLACLSLDVRGFGESGGEPRQEADPWIQVRDVRHAVTFLHTVDEVDPARVAVWGTSYGGGVAIMAGTLDRRVRCVVSQVPVVSGPGVMRALATPEQLAELAGAIDADRLAIARGEPKIVLIQVSDDPAVPAVANDAETYDWMMSAAAATPGWRNELTLQTLGKLLEFEPADFLPRLTPKPLLMMVAAKDKICPPELSLQAYEQAAEPKQPAPARRRALQRLRGTVPIRRGNGTRLASADTGIARGGNVWPRSSTESNSVPSRPAGPRPCWAPFPPTGRWIGYSCTGWR